MALLAAVLTVALSQAPVHRSAYHDYRVVTWVDGLAHPWSIAFLPGGDTLVTEQPGRLRIVRDGKLYGRGASDMKAGIAAAVYAVEAIRRAGVELRGSVEVSGTVDEESGGFAGAAFLCERGWISHARTDHVIIPEPLNVDRVCLGHRGVWWAEIEMKGRIAHGSMPFLGASAIRGMGDFLARVERELYPRLDARRTAMPANQGTRADFQEFGRT